MAFLHKSFGVVAAAGVALTIALAGCSSSPTPESDLSQSAASTIVVSEAYGSSTTDVTSTEQASGDALVVEGGILAGTELFTSRDLAQTADLTSASRLTVADGQTLSITEEGVYVVSGTASNASIVVDADSTAKVQIVLDGVSITNENAPAIYVRSADKVFVTIEGDCYLAVTEYFEPDGDTTVDAVIFSKDDLVLNGTGSLKIDSVDNGVVSKDDLKITSGTYAVSCGGHAFEGKDSVRVAGGSFTIWASEDGLHAENDEDGTLGYVYVSGGSFAIDALSDGVHATSFVQIDGGEFAISSTEGIEGTYVQVNGGNISIDATDDGVNATGMSNAYETAIEVTGGNLYVAMAAGDTDALDSNGNLYIRGGSIEISAQFAFDFDGYGELSGGELYVNGQQITELTNSMMGGAGGGMMGGAPGEMAGGGRGGW